MEARSSASGVAKGLSVWPPAMSSRLPSRSRAGCRRRFAGEGIGHVLWRHLGVGLRNSVRMGEDGDAFGPEAEGFPVDGADDFGGHGRAGLRGRG